MLIFFIFVKLVSKYFIFLCDIIIENVKSIKIQSSNEFLVLGWCNEIHGEVLCIRILGPPGFHCTILYSIFLRFLLGRRLSSQKNLKDSPQKHDQYYHLCFYTLGFHATLNIRSRPWFFRVQSLQLAHGHWRNLI